MSKKKSADKADKPAKAEKTPITTHADGAPGINIGLSSGDRRTISDGLAHFLSDAFTLYLKTHNFHWNVTGPGRHRRLARNGPSAGGWQRGRVPHRAQGAQDRR